MLTELTFAILKYGFLVLLWVFVWLTVRSLHKDIETLSPRKSRAHRRKTRLARKAAESPTPVSVVPAPATNEMPAAADTPTLLVIIDAMSGQWAIEDLGSTNGTVVNQQRIASPTALAPRVPVRIGATTFELR